MTDQKQAPEREVIEFLRFGFTDPSRANVVEALAKQRDELAEALKWYSEDPSSQGDVARAALRTLAAQTGGES